jgi:hypothetical protein
MMSNPIILDTGAPELLVDQIRRRQCRVPTILLWVGTRHCRLLYIIPVLPELISLKNPCIRAGGECQQQISWQLNGTGFSNVR